MALALTAGPAVGIASQSEDEPGLGVSAVRFYRGGASLVELFCRIPLSGLGALPGGGHDAAYRIAVSVRDSNDLELLSQSWTQTVGAATLGVKGASTAEHFRFATHPGRYSVEIAVTDSATGRVSRRRTELRGLERRPEASDLLLASAVRQASGTGDTAAQSDEIRMGSLFLATTGRPVITPQQARLVYYLELYPERAETASVRVRVLGAGGKQIIATAPQNAAVAAEGGVTSGVLDLGGLPQGAYRLELAIATPDSQVTRSATFGMAGLATDSTMASLAPRAQPAASDTFAALREAQLDSMYTPLVYLMNAGEQGIYSTLSVEGKRAFLRQFWAKRDPTPGTPRNEFAEQFYKTVAEADRRFHEGGAAEVPGWRTDRGRIFVRYGPPDEVLSRPQAGNTRPYEVWKYTRVRSRKFIFLDVTAFGHYELIWTDDRRETSLPDWAALLGPEAVDDAMRF